MFKLTYKRTALVDAQSQLLTSEVERLRSEVEVLRLRVHELEQLAGVDELVGLPNRRSFLHSLEKLIGRVARYDLSAAMIFIDVDALKQINDTYGHTAGDSSLVHIARLLQEAVRTSDCVGRLSGDEFGVLLENTDEIGAWNMALRVVERIANSSFAIDDNVVRLSVAVGVGMIKPDDTPHDAIKRADEQMYRIKRPSRMNG
ncbi:GGDEF domain-containing protein [Sphingomonas piscis]|uniref:diguanylate cyclase n=1 Tax=Sphingomonas piscis TaxID=2714943 RepID=A0A6G7YQR3_9SPHN|nr:GGDEF domain-containing protein [Sphingomonas piscis]QIK79088.1 GGDEF domain-containing protein [Sphingomonas piscis]